MRLQKTFSRGSNSVAEAATKAALWAVRRKDGLPTACSRVSLGWKLMPRTWMPCVVLDVSGVIAASVPNDSRRRPNDERFISLPSRSREAITSERSSRTCSTVPLDRLLWGARRHANSLSSTTSVLTMRGNRHSLLSVLFYVVAWTAIQYLLP